MALWRFETPNRVTVPFDGTPNRVGLFTRYTFEVGAGLVQLPDTSWREYADGIPSTIVPANRHFYGATGFADNANQAANYQVPLRFYLGGHLYIIDDTLKTELEAAVTTQEAGGYGAYISAALGGDTFTGDEIIKSGHRWGSPRTVTS